MRIEIFSLFLLILLTGCLANGVVCNKPYILVGSECCLDLNDNNICDIDEEAANETSEEIECEDNGEDVCADAFTRSYDAICVDGEWKHTSFEFCEHGCENGTCITAPPSCVDGTYLSECSEENPGKFCSSELALEWNCTVCECDAGFVCFEDVCITEEEKTTALIGEIQDSVVYVEHFLATGSGVIIDQKDGETVIITNRHVIEYAPSSGITITTRDGKNATAYQIFLAPEKMDLAILKVNGTYGKPANSGLNYSQGQAVLALGSPLGLQGSVSEGIVSNIVSYETDTEYEYIAIQTDAAVNPGNSGGGLFLKSTGELIGINTFKLAGAEGLNFAIDITQYLKMQAYEEWEERETPAIKCRDWTPYGQCSLTKPGLFCEEGGDLVAKCQICGCPEDMYCSSENNMCYECPEGHEAYVKADGYSFCCPAGTEGSEDGTCQ